MTGAETVSAHFQFAPELKVVVDFAVEEEMDAGVGGGHRLLAASDVEDGEASAAERDALGSVFTPCVGAAVELPSAHAANRAAQFSWRSRLVGHDAADSTHTTASQQCMCLLAHFVPR